MRSGARRSAFAAKPGEIYGLLGANGAGKTTTLRMLATILQLTSGTATVAGYDIVDQPAKVRARVGFLSTATALYARLTAREMVEYFGRLNGFGGRRAERSVDKLFAALEMNEFSDRACEKLSTGEKQKVSIARTLVHDPEVMIFDEPTIGLDVMTSRAIVQFIRECRNRGKTVIFSTHVMREVEKLCDHIGIMHGGSLLAEGTLEELRSPLWARGFGRYFRDRGGRRTMSLRRYRRGVPQGSDGDRCATGAR